MSRRANISVRSVVGGCTAAVLATAGALHVVWATGSTFPFRTREALDDAVVGRDATPGPAQCVGVGALLAVGAGVVWSAGRRHGPRSRVAACCVSVVLVIRAAFGFAGRTSVLVPGSDSARFVRNDRWVYSPLCAALAAGSAVAAR